MFVCKFCAFLTPSPFVWTSYLDAPQMMVSRRKILSRSRDELHSSNVFSRANGGKGGEMMAMEEDDCWHTKEKLFQVSTNPTF